MLFATLHIYLHSRLLYQLDMKNDSKKAISSDNQGIQLKVLNFSVKPETKEADKNRKTDNPNTHYTELIQKQQKTRSTQQEKKTHTSIKTEEAREKDKAQQQKNKKSKLPTMKVKCNFCSKVQIVSAKRDQFRCEFCGEKSSCNSIYGVVCCSSCQKKVLYMKGLASMIRCTNCSTINIVAQTQKKQQKPELQL